MKGKTIIFGSGTCAKDIAKELISYGLDVIATGFFSEIKAKGPASIEVLSNAECISCRGFAGDFDVLFEKDGKKITKKAANVIIAEESITEPEFSQYNLIPSSSVISISDFNKFFHDKNKVKEKISGIKKVVFLTGFAKESNPVVCEMIMRASLKLQTDFNIQSYIFTKNLKVADLGLENLYRETKKAGTIYIKFTDLRPEISQEENGEVSVVYTDEITQLKYRVLPDLTVVDESILPSGYIREVAEIFKIDTDKTGFAQSDNIHRTSVFTNIKGIFAAGSARGIQSAAGKRFDVGCAALEALDLPDEIMEKTESAARIDTGKCAKCLTCFRVCPYNAILLSPRPFVSPVSCERCGICTAECPAFAISIKGFEKSDITCQLKCGIQADKSEGFAPNIVAFCCSRSAVRAARLASLMNMRLPKGLKIIEVPCAGSISTGYILEALRFGADGVLILTCHDGSCHSEQGNKYAERRAGDMANLLPQFGLEKERIGVKSLASNMGVEFASFLNSFENKILKLKVQG